MAENPIFMKIPPHNPVMQPTFFRLIKRTHSTQVARKGSRQSAQQLPSANRAVRVG